MTVILVGLAECCDLVSGPAFTGTLQYVLTHKAKFIAPVSHIHTQVATGDHCLGKHLLIRGYNVHSVAMHLRTIQCAVGAALFYLS